MWANKKKGAYTYTHTFTGGKACTCWKTKVLVRGIDLRYLVKGIRPKWFWSKVLTKDLKLYKEEKIIRPRCESIEYLMKC